MDPQTRSLLECSLEKRKKLFWSLFLLPIGTAIVATVIFPRLWPAYLVGLFMSFGFLLVVVQGFELKVSQSNWGRYDSQKQPVGYWVSQILWFLIWIWVSVFPILLAMQEATK